MAVNLDKIKEQLEKLSGQGNKQQRKSSLWSPDEHEPSVVRIIPWPDENNGDPFKERWFYYGIGKGRPIVAPFQFKKPDPISELRAKLREVGTKDANELRDKLKPSRRFYAPVIVRGQEEEGPKIWGFSKTVAKELYDEMMDEDTGDITDIDDGYDVRVHREKAEGQQWAAVKAKTVRKSSPLLAAEGTTKASKSEAEAKIKEWLENVPSLDEIYPLMEYDEIEKRVNDYIDPDSQEESEGTETTAKSNGSNGSAKKENTQEVTEQEFNDMDSAFAELGELVEADA